jgi:uncharacterized protein with PIN domain
MKRIIYTCDLCSKEVKNGKLNSITAKVNQSGSREYQFDICEECTKEYFSKNGSESRKLWLSILRDTLKKNKER